MRVPAFFAGGLVLGKLALLLLNALGLGDFSARG